MHFPPWWEASALTGAPEYVKWDDDLGWIARPGNFQFTDESGKIPLSLTFNSDGSRSSGTAPIDGDLIYLTGDSYVMGHGIGDSDTFAWKLQKQFPELKFKNFGLGGYGTCQVARVLRRYLANPNNQKPVEVLYLLNLFHEERNLGSPLSVLRLKDETATTSACYVELAESGDVNIIEVPQRSRWMLSAWLRSSALIEELLLKYRVNSQIEYGRKATQALIRKIDRELKTQGIRFSVVAFDLYGNEQEYLNYFNANGISFVNCTEVANSHREERLADGHPDGQLNARIAKCIAAHIEDEGLK